MHSSAGTLFGGSTNTGTTTTGSLFGGSTNTGTATTGSIFGSTNTGTATTGSIFGASTNAGTATTGSIFGASTNTGTTTIGTTNTGIGLGTAAATNPFGNSLFGTTTATSTVPTLTSQPIGGTSTGTTTATSTFGFGLSTSGSLLGANASKSTGFTIGTTKSTGFGTTTSFGLSTSTTPNQNGYPHLSVASNPTDIKYQTIYDAAFRASCDQKIKETALIRDLPPKIQELCGSLEKSQTETISKRNQLVQGMLTTAPCLKVQNDQSEDAIFSIPDQLEETLNQFRQFREQFINDQNQVNQLADTTTELQAEVKRLEQLVHKVKTTQNQLDLNSDFKRLRAPYPFPSGQLQGFIQGFTHELPRTISSVYPVSKPTDFVEYFTNLEKSHQTQIQALNQQLSDIDLQVSSLQGTDPSTSSLTSHQQFQIWLNDAQTQAQLLQMKTQASQSRILELRRLAHEGGIQLDSPPSSDPTPPEPQLDPLDKIPFQGGVVKPGWDEVLYEIASTELVPTDLTKLN